MRFFRKRALPKPPSPQEALSSHEQLPSTGIALPTKATTDSMQHPTSASLPTVPGSPPSTPKFTRDILPSDLDKPAATNSAESKNTFFPPVPGSRPLPMQKPALSPQSPVAPWLSEEPSESARRTPPPPPPPPTPSVLPFRKMETTRNPLALSDSSTSSSDENKAIYNTQEPQAVKSPQISKKNQLRPKPKTEVPETAGAVIRQPVLPKKGISQQPAHLRRLSTEETSSGDDITGAVSVPRNKTSQRSQYNAEPMFTKAQRGVLDVPSPTRVKSKPVGSKMNSMPKIAKPTSSTAAAKKKTRRSSTGSESSSETSMLPTIQIKKVVLPSNIEQKRTPFLDSKGPEQQLIVHSKTSSRTGEVSSLTKPPPIISSLPLSKTERPNATTSYQESLSTSSSSTSSNESRSSRQKQSMEAQRAGKERYSKPVVVDTRLLDEEKKKPIPLTKTTRMLPTVSKKKPRDTIRPVKPTRDVLDITKVREDQEITSTERMDTKTTLQQESASIVEEIKQLRDQLASEVLRMETTLRNTPSDIAPVTLTNELDEGNFAYIAGWRELTSGITQPSTPSISFKELELAAQHLITVCRVAQRMLDRYKGVNAQKSFDDESQRLRAYLSQCVPIPVAVRTASHAIQKGRALQILHALELLHKNQALRYAFRTLLYNVRMTGDEVYGSHVPVGIVEQLRKDQCRLLYGMIRGHLITKLSRGEKLQRN